MRTLYTLLHGVRIAGQAAHVVVTAALYLSLVAATRPNGKPGQPVGRIAP